MPVKEKFHKKLQENHTNRIEVRDFHPIFILNITLPSKFKNFVLGSYRKSDKRGRLQRRYQNPGPVLQTCQFGYRAPVEEKIIWTNKILIFDHFCSNLIPKS